MLPIETLLKTSRQLNTPVVAPPQAQQLPVQSQPQVAQTAQGSGPGEFIQAIFGNGAGQTNPQSPQTPQNALQPAPQGINLSVPVESLQPPQAAIAPDNDTMLRMLMQLLGGR